MSEFYLFGKLACNEHCLGLDRYESTVPLMYFSPMKCYCGANLPLNVSEILKRRL